MFHAWRSRLLVKLGLTLMFRGYFDIAWSKLRHENGVLDKILGCFLIKFFGNKSCFISQISIIMQWHLCE